MKIASVFAVVHVAKVIFRALSINNEISNRLRGRINTIIIFKS